MIEANTFKFPRAKSKGVLLQLMSTEPLLKSNPPTLQRPVHDLLQQFEDIFREPQGYLIFGLMTMLFLYKMELHQFL